MRIFVSWSGERSRRLAQALRDWIPYVIHSIHREDIWFSDTDIKPGKRWASDLGDVLAAAQIGLICLTPENRQASWLHFEAGALANRLDHAKVIPVLYGLEPKELKGTPLSQFQATRLDKGGVLKMLLSLNSELEERARVDPPVLYKALDLSWPELEAALRNLEQMRHEPARDSDVPVFMPPEHFYIFITGANSVGKSTVAHRLAERYKVNAVIGTDSLRAALRPWADDIDAPELHWSSFEVADKLRAKYALEMTVEEAFERQCSLFCRSFKEVLAHSRRKRYTAIFEGVNMLPTKAFADVAFHEQSDVLLATLYIDDEKLHRARMLARTADIPAPDRDKYYRNFDRIRKLDKIIRDNTQAFADETKSDRVFLLENSGSIDETIESISARIEQIRGVVGNK